MAIGDVYECVFEMVSDDRVVSISQYYEELVAATGNNFEVTEQLAKAAEIAFWTDFWINFCTTSLVYKSTRCQQVFPTRLAPYVSVVKASETGSAATPPMNGTTAALVSLYGIDWSRNFQGRSYLPGIEEAAATDGRILATNLGELQTAADVFYKDSIVLIAPAGGAYQPSVYSKTLAGQDPVPARVSSVIDSVIARPRIATQRRRRTNVQTAS